MPRIPLEYFDLGILIRIGNKVGKTFCIDHTTLEDSRGNFARLCVEVLSKPLLSKYHLMQRVRRIKYEGLHTIFFWCGCYDHEENSCPEKKSENDADTMPNTFSNLVLKDVKNVRR
ncbi:hypothetical protein LINPERPRIM_LOCUS41015 [Linum perenne]